LIGEIAGANRSAATRNSPGSLDAPQSGLIRPDRPSPLDRGGNRQLNTAIHTIALTRLRLDPATAALHARQRTNGKTSREAIRCLKRHLIRRIYRLLTAPNTVPQTVCLT